MESRDYNGRFEEYLQENADQYKLYPSDRVWNAINKRLHPRTKWPYLFLTALLLGIGFGGDLYDSKFVNENEAPLNLDNLSTLDLAYEPVLRIDSYRKGDPLPPSRLQSTSEQARVIPFDRPTALPVIEPTSEASSPAAVDQISIAEIESGSRSSVDIKTLDQPGFSAPAEQENTGDRLEMPETDNPDISTFLEQEPAKPAMAGINMRESPRNETAQSLSGPTKGAGIKVLKKKGAHMGWQVYLAPTVSYRNLSGEGLKLFQYNNMNSAYMTSDVENSVVHKPAVGFELGTALTYSLNRRLKLKAGVQLNVNRYEVQAYNFTPEVAPLTRGGIGHSTVNAISRHRNFSGYSKTWLQNQHVMMALPIGADLRVLGNDKVAFHLAGTVQPTFIVKNQAYMISTNMKNYAQEPSLYNRYNMALGAEAYLSVKGKSYRWMLGPQFRYQVFSSYKQEYPISEHLTDFGFKIGVSR
jgi:hypothetical protein